MSGTVGMVGVPIVDMSEDDATVAGFLRKARDAANGKVDEQLIYRGHAESSWVLAPELLRNPKNPLEKLDGVDSTLREQRMFDDFSTHLFAFRPELVAGGNPDEDNVLQWRVMALARHFGLPTRFLDFTANPLVALFFAVCEHENEDGVVWGVRYEKRLKVWEVGKGTNLPQGKISPLELSYLMLSGVPKPDRTYGPKWTSVAAKCSEIARRYDSNVPVPNQVSLVDVAFVPEHVDARVTAQSSLFMYELSCKAKRLWQRWQERGSVWGIRIPADTAKIRLRTELSLMGINRASLFPGLEGVAKHIRWWVYEMGNT
jgi:hypothetical protein